MSRFHYAVVLLVLPGTLLASAAPVRLMTPVPQLPTGNRGIFVSFRAPIRASARNDIHRSFGTRVVERIERHHIDTVQPVNTERTHVKLQRLCAAYLLLPEVAGCEIDYAIN